MFSLEVVEIGALEDLRVRMTHDLKLFRCCRIHLKSEWCVHQRAVIDVLCVEVYTC